MGRLSSSPRVALLLALGLSTAATAESRGPGEVDAELLMFLAEFADAAGDVPELALLESAGAEVPERDPMSALAPADPAGRVQGPPSAEAPHAAPRVPPDPDTEAATDTPPRGDRP